MGALFPLRDEEKLLTWTISCFWSDCWKNTTVTLVNPGTLWRSAGNWQFVLCHEIPPCRRLYTRDISVCWARELGGSGTFLHSHFSQQTCCCVVFAVKSRGRWEGRQPWQPNHKSFTRIMMRHHSNRHWPVAGLWRIAPFLFEATRA